MDQILHKKLINEKNDLQRQLVEAERKLKSLTEQVGDYELLISLLKEGVDLAALLTEGEARNRRLYDSMERAKKRINLAKTKEGHMMQHLHGPNSPYWTDSQVNAATTALKPRFDELSDTKKSAEEKISTLTPILQRGTAGLSRNRAARIAKGRFKVSGGTPESAERNTAVLGSLGNAGSDSAMELARKGLLPKNKFGLSSEVQVSELQRMRRHNK